MRRSGEQRQAVYHLLVDYKGAPSPNNNPRLLPKGFNRLPCEALITTTFSPMSLKLLKALILVQPRMCADFWSPGPFWHYRRHIPTTLKDNILTRLNVRVPEITKPALLVPTAIPRTNYHHNKTLFKSSNQLNSGSMRPYSDTTKTTSMHFIHKRNQFPDTF